MKENKEKNFYSFLEDDYLENVGIINDKQSKEIVEKAFQEYEKKYMKLQDFIYGALAIFITSVEVGSILYLGIINTFFINSVLSLIFFMIIVSQKKRFFEGEILE